MTGQGYRYKINTFWNGLRDEKQHGDCKQQTIFNWFPGINVEISPNLKAQLPPFIPHSLSFHKYEL